jgi:DNA repair exonuclease SbcCD nuclease subunit
LFKFIHAADIHLDSPLLGLERYEGAPAEEIRGATRRAFENLVQLAIAEAVDFVLIAGDLYDGDWKDAGTGLYFVKQMARLREAGIPVFLVTGNHDAQNRITRELRFPENMKWFSARKPETATIESLNVAIHGQSYAVADTRENLAEDFPKPAPGAFNIGLLHTCASGLAGHEPYAPCPLPVMTGKGYQYWALGHVHTAQALSEDPPVVFPGNIQGRHIRETGPRGCLLVSVDGRQRITRTPVPLDVFRWYVCEVDATGAASVEEVIERFDRRLRGLLAENAGYPLALRVVLSGTTSVHRKLAAGRAAVREKLQSAGVDLGQGAVWIEKLEIRTRAESGVAAPEGPIRELKEYLDELRAAGGDFEEMWEELSGLREFLPADLRMDCDEARRRELLDDIEALLMDRLLGEGAAR